MTLSTRHLPSIVLDVVGPPRINIWAYVAKLSRCLATLTSGVALALCLASKMCSRLGSAWSEGSSRKAPPARR